MLQASPKLQSQLDVCPFYNGHAACCSAGFERELQKSFEWWVEHWRRKVTSVRSFQMQMTKIQASPSYAKAERVEQQILDKALDTTGPVLGAYGTCFDTLLEYMAGVLCFSCDPHWRDKVFMVGNDHVNFLRVDDSSNEELWQACREFGQAAAHLQVRASDSALAKMITLRFEDLSAFVTKDRVSQYMATLGLDALRGPNEHVLSIGRNGVPPPTGLKLAQPKRQLAASAAPTRAASPQTQLDSHHRSASSRIGATVNVSLADDVQGLHPTAGDVLYPVRDGRSSGLQCSVFPRRPMMLGSGGGKSADVIAGALVAVAGLAALTGTGTFA